MAHKLAGSLFLYGRQTKNAFHIFKGLFKTTNKQTEYATRLKTERGPQKLKYLLYCPLHKYFANTCSS